MTTGHVDLRDIHYNTFGRRSFKVISVSGVSFPSGSRRVLSVEDDSAMAIVLAPYRQQTASTDKIQHGPKNLASREQIQ